MRAVSGAFRNGQRGAALLAFMLVVIVTAATMLVGRLNEHAQAYTRNTETQLALAEAKQALLQYAMNYPELRSSAEKGPGFLPCPAQNMTGTPTSCGGSVTTAMRLGRLPFEILGVNDLRDSSGEQLWYAVSDNFKNTLSDDTVINSETPGLISVDSMDDIVAVVIAPGTPVSDQTARPSITAADYLEGGNEISTDGTFVTTFAGEFNDKLEVVTRRELVQAIERRVLSEIRNMFADYRSAHGAYPWLTPFADPKSQFGGFTGSHDGPSNSPDLQDTTADFFYELGIRSGDFVRNITDGSVATVISITDTAPDELGLGPLSGGIDNDFDSGDTYQILPGVPWTASATSSGVTLVDNLVDGFGVPRRDFNAIGVVPGDVVDNLTDGTSGVVESVSGAQIVLSTGSGVVFDNPDQYVIRSQYGQATGANNSSSLTDSNKNFNVMGVRVGDLVVNLSDGSVGRISSVSVNSLALSGLYLGADNDFDMGDYYYLPRLNTDRSTREGLLSIHEEGKYFATTFTMDSNLAIAPDTDVYGTSSPHSAYVSNLTGVASSALTSTSVSTDEGQCIWTTEGEAYCLGAYDLSTEGTVTSGIDTNVLTDNNADFTTMGVKRGDMVLNFDDEVAAGITGTATAGTSSYILKDTSKDFVTLGITPYYHLLHNNDDSNRRALITEVVDTTTLRLAQFQSGDSVDMAVGDDYTIYGPQRMAVASVSSSTVLTASRLVSTPDFDSSGGGGLATNPEFYRVAIATSLTPTRTADPASSGTTLVDIGANFSEVARGDIVENITDSAFGLITSINDATDTLTAQLYAIDGSTRSFSSGEQYRIYYNHDVVTRRYEFRPRLSGTAYPYVSGKQRKRDVCLGYASNCQNPASNVALPAQSAVVTVSDFDGDGNAVARSIIDIPSGTNGRMRVTGMDYYLREASNELQGWFLKNRWHQLAYAAYSAGHAANGLGSCDTDGGTPPPACLTMSVAFPSATFSDRQALVVTAGEPLSTQNRSAGGIAQYFEGENGTTGNDSYARQDATNAFNDAISVVCPDAMNTACP